MPLFTTKYLLANSTMPSELINKLKRYGIVNALQLSDLLSSSPSALQKVAGIKAGEIKTILTSQFSTLPNTTACTYQFTHPPLGGLILSTEESPILRERRSKLRQERIRLTDTVAKNKTEELPLKMDLTPHLPAIRDQGSWGSCVGFGTTAAREFPVPAELSPGWAYRGAKALDDYPGEGSWLHFAFEYFYLYGHIEEEIYSYQDAIDNKPMEPFHDRAARYRIDGFVDLILDHDDFDLTPTLLKFILSGKGIPDLGPQPVAIGVAVYESAQSPSANRSGMWTIPLPGEQLLGGHAMTIVGYIDANHPQNPLDTTYFLVRNSWGTSWAAENPLEYPGHALIPEGFFSRPDCLYCSILSLAEVSPMKGLNGAIGALWRATKRLIH